MCAQATAPAVVTVRAVSTCTHLPSQIAKRSPFANELNAEQQAKEPDRRHWKAGPEIESYQDRKDAARQDPSPVRKRTYRKRKNHLRNALNHEINEQEKRDHEKACPAIANQEHPDDHRQDGRDKLKPEMRHVARVNETDALHDTANNQDAAQEKDRSERRNRWVDQCQNAGKNHQPDLYQIPKRMPLDRFAHRLAHGLGGSFE